MDECRDGIADTTKTVDHQPDVSQEGQQHEHHQANDDFDDDFADFAHAPPADEPVCNDKQLTTSTFSDEDNFADFQNAAFPTDGQASTDPSLPSVSNAPDYSRQSSPPLPPASPSSSLAKIDQIVRSAFILNQTQLLQQQEEDEDEEEGAIITDSSATQVLTDNVIWHRLKKMSAMNSLNKFKWPDSHTFQSFTQALRVDPQLVEKDGIPIFAANLRLLEPMKADSKSASSDTIVCSTTTKMPAPVAEVLAPEPAIGTDAGGAVSQPVTTDPLVDKMCSLNLDFLEQQESNSDARKSSPNHNSCNVSQLEQELLSDLQVPDSESGKEVRVFEGDKILQTLLSDISMSSIRPATATAAPSPLIQSNGFKDTTDKSSSHLFDLLPTSSSMANPQSGNSIPPDKVSHQSVTSSCKVLGISAEAAQILDELPILSFLRSNLL